MNRFAKEIASFKSGMVASVDDNVLPMAAASRTYNFDTRLGALVDGVGVSKLSLGGEIPELGHHVRKLWQYTRTTNGTRDDRLVAFDGEHLYEYPLYASVRAWRDLGVTLSATPTAINYRLDGQDVLILCSASDNMLVYNGDSNPTFITESPDILSMCVHYERLWAVTSGERDCVWFSSDLDPTNWNISLSGAGFISMPDERGQMLKVLSFLDYVYVFREYGITRLSAFSDQTQFSVTHLFISSGTIFGDTVCLCGDKILFAASDGVYSFDGVETIKILTHLSTKLDARNAHAAFSEGKYYLSCAYDFRDNCGEVPSLLVYDLASKDALFYRDVLVQGLSRVASGKFSALAILFGSGQIGMLDYHGSTLGRPTVKVWATPYTDLGRPDKLKNLVAMTLITHTPLSLTVLADGVATRYEFGYGHLPQRMRLRGSARRIGFVFETNCTDVYITRPILTYEM